MSKNLLIIFIYSTNSNWMLIMCQAGTVLDSGVAKMFLPLPHPPPSLVMKMLQQLLMTVIIKMKKMIANVC